MLPSTFNFLKPVRCETKRCSYIYYYFDLIQFQDTSWRQRLEKAKLYQKYIKSRIPREKDTQIEELEQVKYPIDSVAASQITRQFAPYLELDHLSNGQLATVCNAANLNGCSGLGFFFGVDMLLQLGNEWHAKKSALETLFRHYPER